MMTPAQIKSAASVILALRKNRLNIGYEGAEKTGETRRKRPLIRAKTGPIRPAKDGRPCGADGRKPYKT